MRRVWWLVLLGLVWPAAAKEAVTWRATAEPATAHPGEVATLVMTATIDPAYHIYAASQHEGGMVATSFKPTAGLQPLGGLREPQPQQQHDAGFNVEVLFHRGQVVFRQPFRVPGLTPEHALILSGNLRYQACTDSSCLRPATVSLWAGVRVAAGPVRPEYANPPAETLFRPQAPKAVPAKPGPEGVSNLSADQARAKGLLPFLLVAFLAGFAALLTPCVFPMVPITVSFFTKQAGHDPRKRIGLASAYGLGIVVMYTTLGLILAATMGAGGVGKLASNPVVNLNFAALFVFFALSLFGAFELQLPPSLVNYTSRKSDVGGYLGALFMGLTLTLAAFTCTVQFVGGVLVWAANGEWLWPILGMLAFSTAFALPFVLLALFPQYLASMPKSGGWLETTKVVLGWVELGAALKFLSNADLVWGWRVLTREVVLGLWATCSVLVTVYLWGRLKMGHSGLPERLGHGRRWTGLMFLLLAGYLLYGLTGARLNSTLEALLPPPEYTRNPLQVNASTHWLLDYDEALQRARKTHTNVFIDFTGVTCTNCRWMEENVFTDPRVAQRLATFTLVRLYTDMGEGADRNRALQAGQFHTASLPFYAVVRPDGQALAHFEGLSRDVDAFVAFLDQARDGDVR